ncbi:hypothetical protein OBBRIDRAFT_753829 [Obba rivulosa]|uniref:NadR/Ttd14 AAA domain-containing protein n=1 Tax=Obba rivulosa TaxID=1052685 RepID=A0A8E2AU59_9APHY|nr:hypothetical protein OBBRIDRAFT_753829 [Obba rivulosa]
MDGTTSNPSCIAVDEESHGEVNDSITQPKTAPWSRNGIAIFVIGPSSSGKSTLCDALAAALGIDSARYIKEVARSVMRQTGFTRAHTDTYEMQYAIMTAQLAAEEQVLQMPFKEGIVMLSDRSAIDPIVYAATSQAPGASERERLLLGDAALRAILPLYRRSLFVLLEPVTEWLTDDGVRSLEDPWKYNEVLTTMLHNLGIPFIQIGEETKDIGTRVELVRNCLQAASTQLL